jgi:hypothetical protein
MVGILLPLTFNHKNTVHPVDNQGKIKKGDYVTFLINNQKKDEANEWIEKNGFISGGVSGPGFYLYSQWHSIN